MITLRVKVTRKGPFTLAAGQITHHERVRTPVGTGTTALVADTLGRHGISIDRSADYCRLAAWRTRDPGQRARALGVPKPPPVMDGQGDLFAEVS